PVKCIGAAPGDEVDLHTRVSETLVQIKLVRLDRHLLNIFNARLNRRLSSSAKLHASCISYNPIDIATLRDRRKTVPRSTAVFKGTRIARHQLTHPCQIATCDRQVLD